MSKELNPKFPYRIEKAHWYLLLLWREEIITKEEFECALVRLKEKTGIDFTAQNYCLTQYQKTFEQKKGGKDYEYET